MSLHRRLATVTAVAAACLALTPAVAGATPPPPNPYQGSMNIAGSVDTVAGGSSVTGPQFFEVDRTDHFWAFRFYPYSGPKDWQHLTRIPSLQAGRPDTAKFAVLGEPLPDEFWLGTMNGIGVVGVNRRFEAAPNVNNGGYETIDVLRPGLRSTGQLAVPGVPGTVAAALALPGDAAAGSTS